MAVRPLIQSYNRWTFPTGGDIPAMEADLAKRTFCMLSEASRYHTGVTPASLKALHSDIRVYCYYASMVKTINEEEDPDNHLICPIPLADVVSNDWWLRDSSNGESAGEIIVETDTTNRVIDIGKTGVKEAWLADALTRLAEYDWDGVIIDYMRPLAVSNWSNLSRPTVASNGIAYPSTDSDAAWKAVYRAFMDYVIAGLMAAGYYVLCNNIGPDDSSAQFALDRAALNNALGGWSYEMGVVHSSGTWEDGATLDHKMAHIRDEIGNTVWVCDAGLKSTVDDYALKQAASWAYYLISIPVSNEGFGYSYAGDWTWAWDTRWDFDIGVPVGTYTKDAAKYVYTRTYSNGFVALNHTEGSEQITLPSGTWQASDGTYYVGTTVLPPYGSLVLLNATAAATAQGTTVTLDVRIYGSDGKRKNLRNRDIESVSWELVERGYYGNATISLKNTFDAGLALTGSDYVEIRLNNALRYRGYVGTAEQSLDTPERLSISAYGAAERLNSIIVNKWYAWPGGTDVAVAFAAVVGDFIAPHFSLLQQEIETTGYTLTNLTCDRQSVREVLDSLCDMTAKRAYWGIDTQPSSLFNRVFLRNKLLTEPYRFQLGSKRVSAYSYPPDYSGIVNKVHMVGGEATYPNLVANPSFEQPKNTDTTGGNVCPDPSFESHDDWECDDGASFKHDEYARTGIYELRLDNIGEHAHSPAIPVTAGRTYAVEWWAKRIPPTNLGGGTHHLEIDFRASSNIADPIIGSTTESGSLPLATDDYLKQSMQILAPATATYMFLLVENDNGDVLAIDDFSVYDTGGIAQDGWNTYVETGAPVYQINWAYDAAAYHGAYAVRVSATTASGAAYFYLQQIGDQAFVIKPSTTYVLSARVKNLGASQIAITPGLHITDDTGAKTWHWDTAETLAVSDAWQLLTFTHLMPADATDARVAFKIAEAVDIAVDAVMMTLQNPDDTDGSDFLAGSVYEHTFATTDAFVQADALLPAAVLTSIATYGAREAEESAEGITDLAQARNWALGYFGLRAQPVTSHRVEIAGWETEIAPGALFKLTNSNIPTAYPVRVSYSVDGDGMVNVSLDLNTERPSFERLLAQAVQTARTKARNQM
jgi:hypothetical protein